MSSRQRDRVARHKSVGGQAARDVLDDLVSQFADQFAFIRELIQNSLDAGSRAIHIDMRFTSGELIVAVEDDGDGMDRAIIEGYLLTLFRSTKENDQTKIGKFGIGFASVFAMGPSQVVIDTGRDGVWHRVIVAADRSWQLIERADPFEGTTVRLHLPRTRVQAAADAKRVRDAAVFWCRFADADVTTTFHGGWSNVSIATPFDVDAPVVVREVSDGFEAVVGICADSAPRVGFFNHGLTLWEADHLLIPGVTFRVKGRHLGHTLSRDNVIRDRHFNQVLARVRAVAAGALRDAVNAACVEAAAQGDLKRLDAIGLALHDARVWLDASAPIVPAWGGPVAPNELVAGTFAWLRSFFTTMTIPATYTSEDALLVAALQRSRPVVRLESGQAFALTVESLTGALLVAAGERWSVAEPDGDYDALGQALTSRRVARRASVPEIRLARVYGTASSRLVTTCPTLGEPFEGARSGRVVVANTEHAQIKPILRLPTQIAVVLLDRLVTEQLGQLPRPVTVDADDLAQAWGASNDG